MASLRLFHNSSPASAAYLASRVWAAMKGRVPRIALTAALLGLCTLPTTGRADTVTLTISSWIDGKDILFIRGDTIRWRYVSYWPVGNPHWAGNPNAPQNIGYNETQISISVDGGPATTVDWYPEFSRASTLSSPNPDECESLDCRPSKYTSAYTGLFPALPDDGGAVGLTVLSGRELLKIRRQPSSSDGYRLVLNFNDSVDGAAGLYSAQLTYTVPGSFSAVAGSFSAVPEPSTWGMVLLGFAGLGFFRPSPDEPKKRVSVSSRVVGGFPSRKKLYGTCAASAPSAVHHAPKVFSRSRGGLISFVV